MEHVRTGSKRLLRDLNQSLVLNLIAARGPISRTEIVHESGLPAATVTRITREFMTAGLISELDSAVESTGGRRPILLGINPTLGYVVGVKLREDSMTVAVCDLRCSVLHAVEAPLSSRTSNSPATPYEAFDAISGAVERAVREAGVPRQRVLGVGIGLGGFIDFDRGVCRYSAIMDWRDVELQGPLEYKLRLPVRVDNDVNTLAVAEHLFGAGRAASKFVLVTIGRGIGLGIVMGGEVYRGAHGGAGEFGHTTIDLAADAPECNCGKRGCLEAIASDYGILRAALRRDPGHHVEDTMQTLLARAQLPEVRAIFAHAGAVLGAAIANLINIFDPKLIILAGEGVRAGDVLLEPMREAIPRHTFAQFDPVALQISATEEVDWARGAASLILQEVFRPPIHDTDETVLVDALLGLTRNHIAGVGVVSRHSV